MTGHISYKDTISIIQVGQYILYEDMQDIGLCVSYRYITKTEKGEHKTQNSIWISFIFMVTFTRALSTNESLDSVLSSSQDRRISYFTLTHHVSCVQYVVREEYPERGQLKCAFTRI